MMQPTHRVLAALSFLTLGGCQTLLVPSWSLYAPTVADRTQYEKDRAYCQAVAEGYYAPVDVVGAVVNTVNGALGQPQSAQSAAVGAGANLLSSGATWFGLSHSDERAQYVDCAREKTHEDHSAYLPLQG